MITKACPRCGGALFIDFDVNPKDRTIYCIQCGYRKYPEPLPIVHEGHFERKDGVIKKLHSARLI